MKITFHMYAANGVLDVRVDDVHSGQLLQNLATGHWTYGSFADRSETALVGDQADVETAMGRCRQHLERPSSASVRAGRHYRHPKTGAILFVTEIAPGKIPAFGGDVDLLFRVEEGRNVGHVGRTTLEDAETWIERPAPPSKIISYVGAPDAWTFDVTPTDAVAWSGDYDTWICHYRTEDARIPSEFRAWRAVWSTDRRAWEPAEV